MDNPSVSIIIPFYNRPNLLMETLASVSAQSYANWEALLVDDGSNSETLDRIANFISDEERFQLIKRPNSLLKGANSCRNLGFEKSDGDYIMFLDSDDILAPNCLQERVKFMETRPEVSVAIFSSNIFYKSPGDSQEMLNKDLEQADRAAYLRSFIGGHFNWQTTAAIWRREVLIAPLFDIRLQRFQDVDFHIRQLSNEKLLLARVEQVDNYYRNENPDRYGSPEFLAKVVRSFILLFGNITAQVAGATNYRPELKRFAFMVYVKHVLPIRKHNQELYKTFRKEILGSDIFTSYDRVLLNIQSLIFRLQLQKFSGIGIFRLESYIKRHFRWKYQA